MKTLLAFLLTIFVTVPALAGPPLEGTYKSTEGDMLNGRYSETWVGGKLSVNNTINEASWDGLTLGTEWTWSCAYIAAAPTLVFDGVNANGDGNRIWSVTYTGGVAFLDESGPWGNGEDYNLTVDTWNATVTETYLNHVEVGTVKTVNATASFTGYPETCIVLALSNLEKHDDGASVPAGYPGFINSACGAETGPGEWGEVDDITYSILGCVVSTEEASWGSVKAQYR